MTEPTQKEADPFVVRAARKPLPTFRQWIDKQGGPDVRAPDFEFFADFAARSMDQALSQAYEPRVASFGRMWAGALIAAVELCNIEALKHGREPGEIIVTLPRIFGLACMYAIASVAKDDAPMRPIAKICAEEFRTGTKMAADELEERQS